VKSTLKLLLRLFFALFVLPFFVPYWLLTLVFNRDTVFAGASQCLSLLPGKIGNYYRLVFYQFAMQTCGKDTVISFATLFSQQGTELSDGVYIGPQCNIGLCKIDANCLVGSGVHIMSGKGQHNFSDLHTALKDQGGVFNKVTIGEDSWLGNGALILANVGKKSVVAAGSVVINDVPDFAIVAGNPAKIIKMRNE
jgi:acetyltransferase-like isoleucine patch superfamily enzyme